MKNLSFETAQRKKETIQNIFNTTNELKNQEFDINYLLLNDGETHYLPQNLDLQNFTKKIINLMQKNLALNTATQFFENKTVKIKYTKSAGIIGKINLNETYILILGKFEETLISLFLKEEQIEEENFKESKFNFFDLINNPYQKEIIEIIKNEILLEISDLDNFKSIINENVLIEKPDINFLNWFYTQKEENEILLAKINISEIKKYKDKPFENRNIKTYFIQTDIENLIIAFNDKNELVLLEKLKNELSVSKGIVRNTISSDIITFTSERSNAKLLKFSVKIASSEKAYKIRETAIFNKFNNKENIAIDFLEYLIKHYYNTFDELALFYLRKIETQNSEKNNTTEDYNIIELSNKIISEENFPQRMQSFFDNWKIPINEKSAFTELFTTLAVSEDQKKIVLPYYDKFAKEFLDSTKNAIDKTLFQINYCKFLIQSQEKDKAKNILLKLLKNIPDETLSELIPPDDIDITGDKSGMLLKITIYDLLSQTVPEKQRQNYIIEAAKLQPLNLNRLKLLQDAESEIFSNKATELLAILEKQWTKNDTENTAIPETNILSEKTINENLLHYAAGKNGSLYSIQKWLSKVKPVDYSYVKAFAEKITAQNNNELYINFNKIKKALRQDRIEFYISKGDKSTGITGYESNPPFIIIGHQHLNPNSKNYLHINEIYFLIASEIAYIHFKYSRITSADLWRGAADKGYFIMDSLLNIVPVAGFIEKSLKSINKLNGLTKILSHTKKIKTGKDIVDNAVKISKFYSKIITKNSLKEDRQKLIAASRLMQYTADRSGMLFSGEIKIAVKTIFDSNPNYSGLESKIENEGLRKILLQRNSDNTFKHQDLALRISNLFSFFLSDDYEIIRKELIK